MEGHPPSMAVFVVGLIPLLNKLEQKMTGIRTMDAKTHMIKVFRDDLRLFLSEVDKASDIVTAQQQPQPQQQNNHNCSWVETK